MVEPREKAVEFSIDRVGGDYRDFSVPVDPKGAACRSACEGDNKCRAWTYVRPGYIAVAPDRTPAFEPWGITLRIVQVPLLIALLYLAVRPSEQRPEEIRR